jgi:hypothetical protein
MTFIVLLIILFLILSQVSWLKQHSAPTTGLCLSPSTDKVFYTISVKVSHSTYGAIPTSLHNVIELLGTYVKH